MLQTIVNAPQAVIPYERAAIALDQRGRFKLSAITGLTQVNADAPEIAPLNDVLQWAALSEEVIHVRQVGEEIDAEREETRAKLTLFQRNRHARFLFHAAQRRHRARRRSGAGEPRSRFSFYRAHRNSASAGRTSHRGFAQRADVQGSAVHFRSRAGTGTKTQIHGHGETAAHLEPVAGGRRVLLLFIVPLAVRVDGDSTVAPVARAQVQPEIEGVVGKFTCRKESGFSRPGAGGNGSLGLPIGAGSGGSQISNCAFAIQSSALGNATGEAGVQRVQADYWKTEVDRAKELLDRTQLRLLSMEWCPLRRWRILPGDGCNTGTASPSSWMPHVQWSMWPSTTPTRLWCGLMKPPPSSSTDFPPGFFAVKCRS